MRVFLSGYYIRLGKLNTGTYVMFCAIWKHLYNLKTWKAAMDECYSSRVVFHVFETVQMV